MQKFPSRLLPHHIALRLPHLDGTTSISDRSLLEAPGTLSGVLIGGVEGTDIPL